MIKEEGYIIYTTKDNPTPHTEKVISARDYDGMGIQYTITTDVPHVFQYDHFTNRWYIKNLAREDDDIYERFDGEILSFEYITYLDTGLQETRI